MTVELSDSDNLEPVPEIFESFIEGIKNKDPLDLFDMPEGVVVTQQKSIIRDEYVAQRFELNIENQVGITAFLMDNNKLKLQWAAEPYDLNFQDIYNIFYEDLFLALYPNTNPLESSEESPVLLNPLDSPKAFVRIITHDNSNYGFEPEIIGQKISNDGDFGDYVDLESIRSITFTLSLAKNTEIALRYSRELEIPYLVLEMPNSEKQNISPALFEIIFQTHASICPDQDEYPEKAVEAIKKILDYESR